MAAILRDNGISQCGRYGRVFMQHGGLLQVPG